MKQCAYTNKTVYIKCTFIFLWPKWKRDVCQLWGTAMSYHIVRHTPHTCMTMNRVDALETLTNGYSECCACIRRRSPTLNRLFSFFISFSAFVEFYTVRVRDDSCYDLRQHIRVCIQYVVGITIIHTGTDYAVHTAERTQPSRSNVLAQIRLCV